MAREKLNIELNTGGVITFFEKDSDNDVAVENYKDGKYEGTYLSQRLLKELINFLQKQVI